MMRAAVPVDAPVDVPILAERVRPVGLAGDQVLPVPTALVGLTPAGGLRRGSTLAVDGPAATSLAVAAVGPASVAGSWVAAVGFADLGLAAVAELGVGLDRLVLVAEPEPSVWAQVVATLVDAFDVVLVRTERPVRGGDARRLLARTRERAAVLVQVASGPGAGSPAGRWYWPEGADVTWRVTEVGWEGLGEGHGHLRARRVTVETGGRRDAARVRRSRVWLPSPAGVIETALADPVPLHRPRPRGRTGASESPGVGSIPGAG